MMWKFEGFWKNTALITEDGRAITYAELSEISARLAAFISGRSLVFSLATNTPGSLLGYVTFLNHGIVPLMLDAGLNRDLLWPLIEAYKPDYLWVPAVMEDEFVADARAVAGVEGGVGSSDTEIGGEPGEPGDSRGLDESGDSRHRRDFNQVCTFWDYSLVKTPWANDYPLHSDLALLLTTSGSTGSFKLVRLSYTNIAANQNSIADFLELDAAERPITTLPMSYTYGLSVINSHLSVGAGIIQTTKNVVQREFWEQFRRFEATSIAGVPYTYELLNRLNVFKMDLPSLGTLTQSGGKLPGALHRKFAEYTLSSGRRFVVMYGQTEGTARMSWLPPNRSVEKCGSIGVAIPGGKLSLADGNGEIISEGLIIPEANGTAIGELVYEGANVSLGYAEKGADLAKGDERKGILFTGDIARRDGEGFYYIVGRKKRFLKMFGLSVSLDEVEQMIRSRFECLDCACTGVDDSMDIFVTDTELLSSVKEFVAERTGINTVAFRVQFIESIPKNPAGKTMYSELEKSNEI